MPESEKLILHNDVFRKDELSARHAVTFFVSLFSHISVKLSSVVTREHDRHPVA